MKTVRSEKEEKLAIQLSHIIADRRELEKKETELKNHFKAMLDGEAGILKVGDVLIIISECERSDLDKKSLMADIGEDKFNKFLKTSTYLKTEVKGA